MKKILLSLVFLVIATSLLAQPMHYNATTGAGNTFPLGQAGGKAANWLFPPSVFGSPTPCPPGQEITKIYVRMYGTGTRTFTNLHILMAQTTLTNLTTGTFFAGPYDTVFAKDTSLTSTGANTWLGINLHTPYPYDPTKALVVFMGQCAGPGSGLYVLQTTLTGIKRTWSVAGCPFAPYASGDARNLCMGIDVQPSGPISGPFFEDFETFTVGQRVACQDSINWTTWSHDPCNTTEDPMISNAQAFSPTKSMVIAYNNDLVKELGNDTTGIKLMSFKFYVPTGKTGYWNTLAGFLPSFPNKWGMECYFDLAATGNNGRLFAGSSTAFPFAYTHGSWQTAMLVVNLDVDSARFYMNGTHIRTWRWTAGANGSAVPKRLAGNNFYGALSSNELYVDNYYYNPDTSWLTGVTQIGNTVPTEYALSQNYPNPFNPSTKINFAIPTTGLVTMKIYDVLGKEVATLVNETKVAGTYSVNFDGTNLSSGVYFYRIEAGDFISMKKMMLTK